MSDDRIWYTDEGDEMSFDDIVSDVVKWYNEAPEKFQKIFKDKKEEDLVAFHSNLGMNIRNAFNLWDRKWTPEIVEGVDISADHPDAVSMKVIVSAWKKVNEKE